MRNITAKDPKKSKAERNRIKNLEIEKVKAGGKNENFTDI